MQKFFIVLPPRRFDLAQLVSTALIARKKIISLSLWICINPFPSPERVV
jgi:hypothetical protein